MEDNQPLLSLCIPIYNRLQYLERQLAHFLNDKDLFEKDIHLLISDNCSEDDLRSCCEKYRQKGLRLEYHCHQENIGPDGNFEWCFHHAIGRYAWLLGSDDIPKSGVLRTIVSHLRNQNYGLFHLSMHRTPGKFEEYSDSNDMAVAVNYWFTFMSANIINTNVILTVDFAAYRNSFMIQVPVYVSACFSSQRNAILFMGDPFEKGSDGANNGGYNLFQVFIVNFQGILRNFVYNGLMTERAFEQIKKIEYREFLVGYIVSFIILRSKLRKNFCLTNSLEILNKHYGRYGYAYYYIMWNLVRRGKRRLGKCLKSL